jgi:DNA repair photolyase
MDSHKRLITSIGNKKCPLGCIYCFVDNVNYTGIPKLNIDSAKSILSQIDMGVEVLQPSADVELFLVPNWLEILEKLAEFKKHISFATKSKISDKKMMFLAHLNSELNKSGAILNIAVSITNLNDNWRDIEKNTPSPDERIETLAMLFKHGIPTTVAVRPILPFLSTCDIDKIVEATYRYTYGYLSGPLYLTEEMKHYLIGKRYNYKTIIKEVEWLSGHPSMEVIESPLLEKYLVDKAKQYDIPVFQNNIDAVLKIKQNLLS